MNEGRSSSGNGQKSWLEKLSLALLSEPTDRETLVEMLRDAQQRNLLDADALAMIEGVTQVSEMPVRDVMIPRSQMVVIELDWPLERVLSQVIESGHSRLPVIGEGRDDVVGILTDKPEGVAVTHDGRIYVVTDNDGVEDWSSETWFLDLGPFWRLFRK